MNVIVSIFIFSFLILIHEFGHFAAAKAFGVQVNEFSLFMGPALWQKQIGETLYSLRLIPFGGYCAMEGEEDVSENPRALPAAAWWKRFIIFVAGAFMNFVAGVLLLSVFLAPAQAFIVPVVGAIEPGCAIAGEYGLQVGDRILKVDGENIYTASDFSQILAMNGGVKHDLVLKRGNEKVYLADFAMVKREFPNADGTVSLRYGFDFTAQQATFFNKLSYVGASSLDLARLVRFSLQMLVSGQVGVQDLSGPVGIVKEMTASANAAPTRAQGLRSLLYFGSFIAINLGIMNLLPIPALDGGRALGLLLTTAAEAVTGKKFNPRYEAYVHAAGMALLTTLMVIILFKDFILLFKR